MQIKIFRFQTVGTYYILYCLLKYFKNLMNYCFFVVNILIYLLELNTN